MRTKVFVHAALLAALGLLAPVATAGATNTSAAAADPALVWGYDDRAGYSHRAVDVVHTQLDLNVKGHYRIRIYGRDFVKNLTDLARILFDTDPADAGPEYRLSWYLGRNPYRPTQHTVLLRVETWKFGSSSKVLCPGMRHQVNYARDVITLLVARSCLEDPEQFRWAGLVAKVVRAKQHRFWGHFDYFPAETRFPQGWVVEAA
jgi:hypothetical protein